MEPPVTLEKRNVLVRDSGRGTGSSSVAQCLLWEAWGPELGPLGSHQLGMRLTLRRQQILGVLSEPQAQGETLSQETVEYDRDRYLTSLLLASMCARRSKCASIYMYRLTYNLNIERKPTRQRMRGESSVSAGRLFRCDLCWCAFRGILRLYCFDLYIVFCSDWDSLMWVEDERPM